MITPEGVLLRGPSGRHELVFVRANADEDIAVRPMVKRGFPDRMKLFFNVRRGRPPNFGKTLQILVNSCCGTFHKSEVLNLHQTAQGEVQ